MKLQRSESTSPSVCLGLLLFLGLAASACSSPNASSGSSMAVSELIVEGRSSLDAGDPLEAEALFQRAATLDADSFEPRLWILRAWMDQGRSNDTLDALDELGRSGHQGPEMDYLYGMAFARRAEGHIAAGVTDASIEMNFQDATALLNKAVEAAPGRFPDAHLALARSAWMIQDLDQARDAAERAAALDPDDPDARLMLGRVAFSQFVATKGEEDWGAEAEGHWETARQAFEAALEGYGDAGGEGDAASKDAALELGHALMWKGLSQEAVAAYGDAISRAPEAMDYPALLPLLDGASFHEALERGAAGFAARDAEEASTRDAGLQWWLGYARLTQEDFVGSEEAFRASLAKEPGFVNAWFYVALARYGAEDYDGALRALRSGWEADPAVMVAAMRENQELNLAKVAYMVSRCAQEDRLGEAAFLSRLCAETAGSEPTYWSDLGLFLRDEGEGLAADGMEADARERYESALAAYERALQLAPEDPQILNDTAVMLHYYLERDMGRALAMYARAKAIAAKRLEAGDLTEPELDVVRTALRDSTNNLELLREVMSRG